MEFKKDEVSSCQRTEGILNEEACIELLKNFSKFLRWYLANRQECVNGSNIVPQMIWYTGQLVEVFNNSSSIRVARLLESKMPVLELVMKLSLGALYDNGRPHTDSKYEFRFNLVAINFLT